MGVLCWFCWQGSWCWVFGKRNRLSWGEWRKKQNTKQTCSDCTALLSVFHQNPINIEEVFLEFLGTGNFHWPLEKFHCLKGSRVGSGTSFTLFPAHLLSQHNPFYLFIKVLSTHSASFALQRVLGEKQLTFPIPLSLLMLNSIFLPQILGTTCSHFSWQTAERQTLCLWIRIALLVTHWMRCRAEKNLPHGTPLAIVPLLSILCNCL